MHINCTSVPMDCTSRQVDCTSCAMDFTRVQEMYTRVQHFTVLCKKLHLFGLSFVVYGYYKKFFFVIPDLFRYPLRKVGRGCRNEYGMTIDFEQPITNYKLQTINMVSPLSIFE